MTKLINIQAVDSDGSEHQLQAPVGTILMDLLRDAGLDIEAVCGGCCACATCHVFVDARLFGARDALESALVSQSEHFSAEGSRLSCQLRLNEVHQNAKVVVAPEE